jgi:hypothetical protein
MDCHNPAAWIVITLTAAWLASTQPHGLPSLSDMDYVADSTGNHQINVTSNFWTQTLMIAD